MLQGEVLSMGGRFRRALFVAVAISTLTVVPTQANEFAYGYRDTDLYDGIRGNMGIRTDPATVSGIAYVHPVQLILAGPTDFVAIGTTKGAGTTGGTQNCSAHYDPGAHWSGYYDRVIDNVYLCQNFGVNLWVAGDSPSFEIQYSYCPTIGNRWVLKFAGVQRTCMYSGNTQGNMIAAALEAYGTTDRNIDVKYTNMNKNHPGSTTWSVMGDTRPGYADPNYTYQYVSTSAFNVFLAPLD